MRGAVRVLLVLALLATVFASPRSFRPADEGDEVESRRDRQGDVRSIPDWGKRLGGSRAADWGKRIAAAAHSRRRKPAMDTRAKDRLKRQDAIGVQRRDRRGEKRDKPKPSPSDDDDSVPKPKPKPKPSPSDDDDSVPKPKPKPVPADDDTSVDTSSKIKRDGLHGWFRRTSKGIKRDAMRGPRDGKDRGRGGGMSENGPKRRPKNGPKRESREEGRDDRRADRRQSKGRKEPPAHKSSLSAVDVLHAVVQPKEKK